MKSFFWPIIHNFKLNSEICLKKYPWGFISQASIENIIKKEIPKSCYQVRKIELDNLTFDKKEFYLGAEIGYKALCKKFLENQDFLEINYTTPKLSLGLNYILLQLDNKIINIDTSTIDIEILGIWEELGIAKTNDKFLGLWCKDMIKTELVTGGLGPEVKILWDQLPMRQKVKVLYTSNNRKDILIWERELNKLEYQWTINNINGIIV